MSGLASLPPLQNPLKLLESSGGWGDCDLELSIALTPLIPAFRFFELWSALTCSSFCCWGGLHGQVGVKGVRFADAVLRHLRQCIWLMPAGQRCVASGLVFAQGRSADLCNPSLYNSPLPPFCLLTQTTSQPCLPPGCWAIRERSSFVFTCCSVL